MKKVCCMNGKKYRKLKNPNISYVFYKTAILSIICNKFGSKDEKIFKEEESMRTLNISDLVNDIMGSIM